MQSGEFKYGDYRISYTQRYYEFVKEVFILGVYRSSLIKENYFILDLGAGTGDFFHALPTKYYKS